MILILKNVFDNFNTINKLFFYVDTNFIFNKSVYDREITHKKWYMLKGTFTKKKKKKKSQVDTNSFRIIVK